MSLTVQLIKVVSGGQTGVDQGALQAALDCGLHCGGWCPPGRECETGRIAEVFPLQETPRECSPLKPDVRRSQRTEWNVYCSDATLILLHSDDKKDDGTQWTMECAKDFARPYEIFDPFDADSASKILRWIKQNSIRWLNVAGPSEKTVPGIQQRTHDVLVEVFRTLPPQSGNSPIPNSATKYKLERLWQWGIHEDSLFRWRLTFIVLAQSVFVAVVVQLLRSGTPNGLPTHLIAIAYLTGFIALVLTVVMSYVQYWQARHIITVAQEIRMLETPDLEVYALVRGKLPGNRRLIWIEVAASVIFVPMWILILVAVYFR
jgi:hypothetical protein